MLSALPPVQTPSALAAADSLGTAQRSSTEGGSGFAVLMQRQSELRVSGLRLSELRLSDLHSTEQRLAEQRQSQARQAEPGGAELPASVALQNGAGKPPGSGAGAEHASGDPNSSGSRSTAFDDRAGLYAGSGTGTVSTSTSSTPSAAGSRPLDNSTENRNAASLSLNGKLQRARSAAPDASRQAAAGATPQRAGARHAPSATAEQGSGSAPPDAKRLDELLPDPTAAAAATLPSPTAAAPDAEGVTPRGDNLPSLDRTHLDRTNLARLPANSGAAEAAGPSGSSRSTAGWVADQQRLQGAGTGRPTAPDNAGLAERVATAPDPTAGQPATSDAAMVADLLAPAPAGTSPSTLPDTVPHNSQAGALTGTAAAPTAAAANAGARQRGAALPGTPDGSGPQDPANTHRTGTASNLAPALPDQADAGSAVRRAGMASPATRSESPAADPTTGAAQTPDAGMPARVAESPTADSASATQSAQLIDTGDATGSSTGSTSSTAMTGSVTVSPDTIPADAAAGAHGDPAARRMGELAAANSGAKTSTIALAATGQMSGMRTVATAGAYGLPGQSFMQAGDVVGPNGPGNAARPSRSSSAPASPGAETAVSANPSPVADLALAGNPASAPIGSSASASEFSNASTSAAQRAGPVAGVDPRRALATAAMSDGTAVSLRPTGAERGAALARDGDGASAEAADPAALPANRRAAEPAKNAAPLASAEPVSLPPSAAAANGAGPDNGLSRHPGQSVAAIDGGPAQLTATTPAAAPAAALHRSDATGPNAAPVEARVAVPLDSPAFAPALGAQISLFARDGIQTARLQLNPAEMGPIAVQIALDGNAARIDFQADRAATREVIEASLPALAGALQDAGLTLTGGGVFQQHPGRQAPPEPGPAPAAARLPTLGTGFDAVAGGLAASSRQRTPRGLVDLVA